MNDLERRGFIELHDGTLIKASEVVMIGPLEDTMGGPSYKVLFRGNSDPLVLHSVPKGFHAMPREVFLTFLAERLG